MYKMVRLENAQETSALCSEDHSAKFHLKPNTRMMTLNKKTVESGMMVATLVKLPMVSSKIALTFSVPSQQKHSVKKNQMRSKRERHLFHKDVLISSTAAMIALLRMVKSKAVVKRFVLMMVLLNAKKKRQRLNAKYGSLDATSVTSTERELRHAHKTNVLLKTNHSASKKRNHS